jgi:murein L,D-transpeptidase YafK
VSDRASADGAEPLPDFELDAVLGPDSEPKVDRIHVFKSERRMVLLSGEIPVYEYEVALGGSPIGPKRELGDERTPEGEYVIDSRKADSDFHLALHVSYPNADDRLQARDRGVEPGGAIMIHGLPNGFGLIGPAHRLADWTDGCIAVTNEEIEEIWRRVADGVAIDIRP